jgi:hypothetical protein
MCPGRESLLSVVIGMMGRLQTVLIYNSTHTHLTASRFNSLNPTIHQSRWVSNLSFACMWKRLSNFIYNIPRLPKLPSSDCLKHCLFTNMYVSGFYLSPCVHTSRLSLLPSTFAQFPITNVTSLLQSQKYNNLHVTHSYYLHGHQSTIVTNLPQFEGIP